MEAKKVLFSVIIPTYNRVQFIRKTIESILLQEYSNFEILVVDDGSTDDTEQVVCAIQDDRISYIKVENGERGRARNTGARLAKGEYINFLDSDDLLYNNHLSEAHKLICSREDLAFFHLGYDIKCPNGELIKVVNDFEGLMGPKLINGNALSCNGVFLRSDVATKLPFSEERSLSAFEDWELWLRLVSRYVLEYTNTITSTVVNHDQRSVLDTDINALIKRRNTLINSLNKDEVFLKFFKGKINLLHASLDTYVALHIAITKKNRLLALKYLFQGILHNPKQIFTRRFLAVLKHLF